MGLNLPKFRWFESRPRVAWCCRWVLAGVAVLVIGVWVLGWFFEASWWVPRWFRATTGPGAVIVFDDPMLQRGMSMMEVGPPHEPGLQVRSVPLSGWASTRLQMRNAIRPPIAEKMGNFVDNMPMYVVVVPLWLPLVLTAPPALAAWRNRWVVKREVGVCRVCGYSRDGLAIGAACPECGEASRA